MCNSPSGTTHQVSRKQLISTIFGLQVTLLLSAMDQTIVATAMPRVIADLNGFERYAWVTTSYLLTSTAVLPLFGRLSDMYGRKWLLLLSVIGFVLSSALCGMSGRFPDFLGDGMTQLIIFRGLQGVFGGGIMSLVFTVIGDLFPPAERGKYQGLFSAVFALASVVGPALGGFITDNWTWRWVFYVNAPIGILAVLVLWLSFPTCDSAKRQHRIDYFGAATIIGWVVPLLLALTWFPMYGIASPLVLSMLALTAVFLVAFVYNSSHNPEPIVPLGLLANPIIGISCISLLLLSVGMFGAILFIPLFFQAVEGVSATKAGSFLTPMMLMMTVGSVLSGQLISRVGHYKVIAIVGLSIMSVGFFLLSHLTEHTDHIHAIGYMLVLGIGLGLLMPLYTIVSQNAAPMNMIGVATALTQFFRSIGGTLGAAIFNTILLSRYNQFFHHHWPAQAPKSLMPVFANPLKLEEAGVELAHRMGNSSAVAAIHAAVLETVKQSLVFALDGIFVVASAITVCCLVVNLFLKELELRKAEHHVPAAPADEELIL